MPKHYEFVLAAYLIWVVTLVGYLIWLRLRDRANRKALERLGGTGGGLGAGNTGS